jgi:hypothetical protein
MVVYKSLIRLIFVLTVRFKLINSVFQIFPSLVLKVLPASRLTLFLSSPFILHGFCNHCNLACLLLSNNFEIFREIMVYVAVTLNDIDSLLLES